MLQPVDTNLQTKIPPVHSQHQISTGAYKDHEQELKNLRISGKTQESSQESKLTDDPTAKKNTQEVSLFRFEEKNEQMLKNYDWGVMVGILGTQNGDSVIPKECLRVTLGRGKEVPLANLRINSLQLVVVFGWEQFETATLVQLLAKGARLLLVIQSGKTDSSLIVKLEKYLSQQLQRSSQDRQKLEILIYSLMSNQHSQMVELRFDACFSAIFAQKTKNRKQSEQLRYASQQSLKMRSTTQLQQQRMFQLQAQYFKSQQKKPSPLHPQQPTQIQDLQLFLFSHLHQNEQENDHQPLPQIRKEYTRQYRSRSVQKRIDTKQQILDQQFFTRY